MGCQMKFCFEKEEPYCFAYRDTEWPGCSEEKRCLAGDIMPTGPDHPNADSLKCCGEDEECLLSPNPMEGSKCMKKLVPRKLSESCGSCYCPPRYTMGPCEEGLVCHFEPGLADAPGTCHKPETVACEGDLEYHRCGSACPNVCGKPEVEICTEQCVAGCACKFGLFRKGNKCVPKEQCGPLTPCKKLKDLASAKARNGKDCTCKFKKNKAKCKDKKNKVRKVKCSKIKDVTKCLENAKCMLSGGKKKKCQNKPKRL